MRQMTHETSLCGSPAAAPCIKHDEPADCAVPFFFVAGNGLTSAYIKHCPARAGPQQGLDAWLSLDTGDGELSD